MMMSLGCKFSLKLWHLSSFLSSQVTVTWFSEVLSTHHLPGGAAGTRRTRKHFYAKHLPGSEHSSIKLLFWIQLHSVATQEIISPGVKLRTLGLAVQSLLTVI